MDGNGDFHTSFHVITLVHHPTERLPIKSGNGGRNLPFHGFIFRGTIIQLSGGEADGLREPQYTPGA